MVALLVAGSHLFACLACCLVRRWIYAYVSLQRLDSDPAVRRVSCACRCATTGARGPVRSVHAALAVDNNGSTRLVLLVMIHFALYSQLLLNTVIDVLLHALVEKLVACSS